MPIVKEMSGHQYSIDTFKGTVWSEKDGTPRPSNGHTFGPWNNNLREIFESNLKDYKEYMTVLEGLSSETIPLLPDNMDIIYIDASHYYKDVLSDITLCLPKLQKGGIICGDDCESSFRAGGYSESELNSDSVRNIHCGVVQAVHDVFGDDVILDYPIWMKIV